MCSAYGFRKRNIKNRTGTDVTKDRDRERGELKSCVEMNDENEATQRSADGRLQKAEKYFKEELNIPLEQEAHREDILNMICEF